jgi:N utilization substance protein A
MPRTIGAGEGLTKSMKSDFLIALTQLAAERNLPREIVLSAIEAALVSAYRKDSIAAGQDISVKLDPGSGEVSVYLLKKVVEDVEDPQLEMTLKEAQKFKADAEIGESVAYESLPHSAGRIAAQTAKQVVLQRLREAERELVYEEFADKEGEVYTVTIQRIEPKQIVAELGRAEAVLPPSEQVYFERYRVGQKMKVLLKSIERSLKGPELIVSRADKLLLRRLFEMEVPEIYNGSVEIKAIAREPGARSKVAVWSAQTGVDPVGSCVGLRGIRIQNIVNELHGEKIDVVEWDPDPTVFIAHALSPSQVLRVDLNTDDLSAVAVVPDRQLSLAIGKEGQNARLAAKLTGWKVDIQSDVDAAAAPVKPKAAAPVAATETVEKVAAEPKAVPADAVAVPLDERPFKEIREFALELGVDLKGIRSKADTLSAIADHQKAAAAAAPASDAPKPEPVKVAAVTTEELAEAPAEPEAPEEPKAPAKPEIAKPVFEVEKPTAVPEPVGVAAPSLSELPEEVWTVRRPAASSEPGQIRFAEDIEELRPDGPGRRRRTGGRRRAYRPRRR